MFGRYHPRWLAERADFTPFTFTTTIVLTQSDTTSSTTTASTSSTSSFTFTTQSVQTSAPISIQTPAVIPTSPPDTPTDTPVASPITSSSAPSDMADSSVSGTRKISAGAIVGIVLAGVIVVLAGLMFFLRNRFKKRRQQRRTRMQGVPSQAVTASSFAPYPQSPMRGDISPGISFARAQQQTLVSRPPVAAASTSSPPPYITATVKFSFMPDLSDELEIVNGETLTILQEFDDGWALCANRRGLQGMVPLECLDRKGAAQYGVAVGSARDVRNSKRVSSLQSES